MKHLPSFLFTMGCLGFLASGCVKDPIKNINQDESRLYITHRDSTTQFSSFSTFSVADSVAVIENNQLSEKSVNSFDQQLISTMVSMMRQRGYTLVDKNSDPDIVINISRVYNDYSGLINYADYYGSYYGYYDPYYWGYAGYDYYFPPIYGTYAIRDGGINIDMFDAKDAASTNQLRLIWNGLIRGSGTFSQTNIENNIAALFGQSAYIRKN